MTLRGLAREMKLPYSTIRKYVMILKEHGLITIREGPIGKMISDDAKEVLGRFIDLLKEGFTIDGAIKKLKIGRPIENDSASFILKKLESLENDIKEMKSILLELSAGKKKKRKKKWWLFNLFNCKNSAE